MGGVSEGAAHPTDRNGWHVRPADGRAASCFAGERL